MRTRQDLSAGGLSHNVTVGRTDDPLIDLASSGNYYVGPQAYPLGKHSFFGGVANRQRICLRLPPRGRVDAGKSPVGGASGASNIATVCALITRAVCPSGDQAAEPSCVR